MTTTSKAVFSTGWSVFLGVALLFAIFADFASPTVDLPSGKQLPVFGAGSALLGWFVCVLIPLLPAFVYRECRDKPLHKGIAVVWWLVSFGVLILILSPAQPSTQPFRPSFVLIGSLFLCWRLLTWKPGQTAPGVVNSPAKNIYFRRSPSSKIEGPGPIVSVRQHLMKTTGLKGAVYVEATDTDPNSLPTEAWRLLNPNL